ncbi:hypothetical protein BDC45DRAFT_540518 [Circinella umbellata]|nr:hypothetical protein BDC45DRAFT_542476 [Circinella umbellata]KAI7848902.1 hypothetical protein BDC45DRAFT_540518 [Circinella umbellata]
MDNNNTNNTDFVEGDPMPYSRLNVLGKLAHRRRMLPQHRTSLEEAFLVVGMNVLFSNKYMSDEESDDEDSLTRPISVLRPSYRSDIANRFLEKLDQLHVASIHVRRHQDKNKKEVEVK